MVDDGEVRRDWLLGEGRTQDYVVAVEAPGWSVRRRGSHADPQSSSTSAVTWRLRHVQLRRLQLAGCRSTCHDTLRYVACAYVIPLILSLTRCGYWWWAGAYTRGGGTGVLPQTAALVKKLSYCWQTARRVYRLVKVTKRMVPFHILGMVSYYCAVVTLSVSYSTLKMPRPRKPG